MTFNIASLLVHQASKRPSQPAVVWPAGKRLYATLTFDELNRLTDRYAHALHARGLAAADRVIVLVHPPGKLLTIVIALLKMGAIPVLIDPGMGRRALVRCIGQVRPRGFLGIPRAHALRLLSPSAFHSVDVSAVVGRCSLMGPSIDEDRARAPDSPFPVAVAGEEDLALIAFTSGSTGTPKGVLFHHGMLFGQVRALVDQYAITPGEIDLSTLPFLSMLSLAHGMTVVLPDMDFAHPARVEPSLIAEAIVDHGATNAFGSPDLWERIVPYCRQRGLRFSSLRRVLVAGAPASVRLVRELKELVPAGDVYTPYGATEGLPLTSIASDELIHEAGAHTRAGGGICVGRAVPGVSVRIIQVTDTPLPRWSAELEVPVGTVGEVIVKGAVVSRGYLAPQDANAAAKIQDEDCIWHRTGDLGYLDSSERLWLCARKSQRVETAGGPLFPDQIEALFNEHRAVRRTALVGIGPRPRQRPVLIGELAGRSRRSDREHVRQELLAIAHAHPRASSIETVLFHRRFPTDTRHNAKIRREELAVWAEKRMRRRS